MVKHPALIAKILRSITVWGLGLFLVWSLKDTVVLVLVAVVFASFIERALEWLSFIPNNRGVKLFVIYALTTSLFGLVLYLFVPVFVTELAGLSTLLPEGFPGIELIETVRTGAELSSLGSDQNPGQFFSFLTQIYQNYAGIFISGASGVLGGITSLVLVFILSLYLSAQEKGIEKFLRIITPIQNEEYVLGVWKRTDTKIGDWFQGQLVLALIIGLVSFIALRLVGLPYAFLLSLLAAMFSLVPFGSFFASIPSMIIAVLTGGFNLLLWVLVVYIVIQQLENYLLQPLIIRKATGVPPLVVILSLIMGVQLFGFWGLFLAIPLAVFVLEMVSDYEKKKVKKSKKLAG